MIYLIRHAEKENSSVHAKLTKKGLESSFIYGKNLKKSNIKLTKIITSPIERCLQTSQKIAEAYKNIIIEESSLLGNPGIFVNDGDLAMDIFNQYKLIDIINMQLSNQELEGFNDIKNASNQLLNLMKTNKDNTLYISHDAIISPFIFFIKNRKRIVQNEIVNYLDGYSCNKNNSLNLWSPYSMSNLIKK
ncbi:MAG: hypothetical protein COB02_09390 [Candidatus Cloacimonadota bacterium]|nr:MAG: hypothetical protein COB02_09390 [Candidatus Cloacimonadota bacterium]